jgi:hypothetical protein
MLLSSALSAFIDFLNTGISAPGLAADGSKLLRFTRQFNGGGVVEDARRHA